MTTLHDRLSDLADEAPAGAPPGDLWGSGRRLHRRQSIGSGLVVAVVVALLAGLTGWTWSRSDVDVQPAEPETELGMPDRIFSVSERLPGTDDVGPIGPLSAVVPGYERLVGISGTGEYAYLDLPAWPEPANLDLQDEAAVSSDGTQVAYWSVGEPSGEPVSKHLDPVVAVRVYDTVTEDVAVYAAPTEHGLNPEGLVWAGDTLWFEIWQYDAPRKDGGQSSSLEQTVAWDPSTDAHSTWEGRPPGVTFIEPTPWRDALVTLGGEGALRLTSVAGTQLRARITLPTTLASGATLDASGSQLVAIGDASPSSSSTNEVRPLWVADLPEPADPTARVAMRQVPGTGDHPSEELLGWRDDTHVVVARYGQGSTGIESVDVGTGEAEVLVPLDEWNLPVFATDALAGRVFDAPAPPDPPDPRLYYGGIAIVLLAGAGALVWWRRRVQR